MEQSSKQMKVNRQFYDLMGSNKRIQILLGGTRSGKSYATVQYIMFLCLLTPERQKEALGLDYVPVGGLTFSIVRKWLPSLKKSIYRDFFEVIRTYGYYDESKHNKSDLIYELNGNTVEFFATGLDSDRLRSMKRNILYINEMQELNREEFKQLNFRTDMRVLGDLNPSMSEHWIYDLIDNRPDDVIMYHSTYKDNMFLPDSQRKEIEELRRSDPESWKVYGEGKRATLNSGRIYKGWEKISEMPDGGYFYGLDYGYTKDPTALVKCHFADNTLYIKPLMYATKVNHRDISNVIVAEQYYGEPIYCDTNQPIITEELRRMGLSTKNAMKGNHSLVESILKLRAVRVFLVEDEKDLWKDVWKEYNNYSWKLKQGMTPDDKDAWEMYPEKNQSDHFLDSIRYGYYTHYFKGKDNFFVV